MAKGARTAKGIGCLEAAIWMGWVALLQACLGKLVLNQVGSSGASPVCPDVVFIARCAVQFGELLAPTMLMVEKSHVSAYTDK